MILYVKWYGKKSSRAAALCVIRFHIDRLSQKLQSR